MLTMDLFTELSLKIHNEFLDFDLCDLISSEMRHAEKQVKAKIVRDNETIYDEEVRKTFRVTISKYFREQILVKIANDLQPELEEFFKVKFKGHQPLQFLSYEAGHYFRAHQDETDSQSDENARKVTVIIFLNQQGEEKDQLGYGGGDLVLYGLFENAPQNGFTIPSRKGMLVAFKSNTVHEVTPISWGNRYSLVTWFT